VKLCKAINRLFPLPIHPFNLKNEGVKSYAQWQYEKGIDTIRFYLDKVTPEKMFKGKTVLDIGCGAGGKTLYYASQGVSMIYGIDILPKYEAEAYALAAEKGLQDKFRFLTGDAANLNFGDGFFDAIVMNDAMEHVGKPLEVLKECYRVLKPGGRLYLNFPPYYHPFGAHLSDAIGIPWVHILFSEKTLIEVYRQLVLPLPDGEERVSFRISRNKNGEYFSYINRMTIARFKKLLADTPFNVYYYREIPLRNIFKPIVRIPGLKEGFVKMAVCILEKA